MNEQETYFWSAVFGLRPSEDHPLFGISAVRIVDRLDELRDTRERQSGLELAVTHDEDILQGEFTQGTKPREILRVGKNFWQWRRYRHTGGGEIQALLTLEEKKDCATWSHKRVISYGGHMLFDDGFEITQNREGTRVGLYSRAIGGNGFFVVEYTQGAGFKHDQSLKATSYGWGKTVIDARGEKFPNVAKMHKREDAYVKRWWTNPWTVANTDTKTFKIMAFADDKEHLTAITRDQTSYPVLVATLGPTRGRISNFFYSDHRLRMGTGYSKDLFPRCISLLKVKAELGKRTLYRVRS